MPRFFLDSADRYFETTEDTPAPRGCRAVPQRPDPWARWGGSSWIPGSEPEPTTEEKDAMAVEAERDFADRHPFNAALVIVLAEFMQRDNPLLTKSAAIAEVRRRFREAYRQRMP